MSVKVKVEGQPDDSNSALHLSPTLRRFFLNEFQV